MLKKIVNKRYPLSIFYPNKFNITITLMFLAGIYLGTNAVPYFTLGDVANRLPSGAAFSAIEAIMFSMAVFVISSVLAYKIHEEDHGR